MGKQNVPIKARKAGGGGGAAQKHTPSAGGRKHGGIGANNSFDNLMYRSKHEVLQLGKPKGKLKRPAASLSASLAARQQSLLAEFGAREKANSFIDERLEEHNSALDAEDKLLLRFQKERQKRLQAGGGRFALDDAEDTMQLTHQGQALSLSGPKRQRDEGEEEGASDEDEEAQERRLASSRAHGDEEEEGDEEASGEGASKSRHEVMSEVMLKSKMYRAERAVLAGEQQDLMGNLDTEFDLVRGQMQWAGREEREAAKRASRAAEAQAAGLNQSKGGKSGGGPGAGGADGLHADGDVVFMDAQLDPTDEFVLEARQLGLDVRAKASDRLKSDEEIIAQEKRRLEKLERQRLKRMRGEVDGGADELDDDDEPKSKRRRERKEAKEASRQAAKRQSLPRTDDDLESNVLLSSSKGAGRVGDDEHELLSDDEEGGADGDSDDEEEEEDSDDDSDEDSDEEEEEEADAPPAQAEDDDDAPIKAVFIGSTPSVAPNKKAGEPKEIFIGNDGKSSVSSALLAITAKLAGKTAPASGAAAATAAAGGATGSASTSSSAASTLPFTFPAPSSYAEFKTLLSSYPASQHSTIIARIRTCNHVSLLPSNAQKMEKFYAILLTHFRRLASDYARLPAADKNEAGVAALVARMDEIAMHVSELSELHSMNGCVGRSFRAQLSKMRAAMDASSSSTASFEPDSLLLLKLLASLFPTSDFRHNVATPALLLLAEWLNRLPVTGAADMVRGFFAVSLLLHAVNASKRLVPEVITFLHAALLHGMGIARSEEDKAPLAAAPAAAAAAPTAGKKSKKGASAQGSSNGAPVAPAASETGAPATGSAGEVFSATPSALRLHASLQARNCNFLPSAQLAIWAPMLKAAAAPSKQAKTQAQAPSDADLHIPLHWLFHDNDAPVFGATSGGATTAAAAAAAASMRSCTYATALQLVHQAAQLWQSSSPCYAELFTPLLDTLGHVLSSQKNGSFAPLPPTLQSYTQHLHSYLSSSIAHSISLRTPLEASLAPLALKSHAPLFTEGYNPTKDYDPVKERAQIKELAQKLKREKKGALRELRRDTAVVVQQQRAIQQAHAAEREAKRKEVWSQMEEQQRDTNILQKASKKAQDKKDSKKSKKK